MCVYVYVCACVIAPLNVTASSDLSIYLSIKIKCHMRLVNIIICMTYNGHVTFYIIIDR